MTPSHIINTTFQVDQSVEKPFLTWLRNEYIPTAAAVGLTDPQLCRLLIEVEEGAVSYAFQLRSDNPSFAQAWFEAKASRLLNDMTSHFSQKVLYFTTFMEQLAL